MLLEALRQEGARRGIRNFKAGTFTYASTQSYGSTAPWYHRHPEAFTHSKPTIPGTYSITYFDPSANLHRDPRPLGGLPNGIPEGMPVHEAFALQWGSLSHVLGIDALMLRDSFGMPVPYERRGPFGLVAPSPQVARRWNNLGVAALVRETKKANPDVILMMYSNAASAIGDWRCNCCDLEAIAKEGYLDVFVDQTWAGAWNEVGVRYNDFWNQPGLGYTYQLAYMLMHAAILADTKVRHYPLVETFDAWESWNVIGSVPERLRWEIWAYLHVGVKTPNGLKLPGGSYISWANNGGRLMDQQDVTFLAHHINAASADARKTTEICGPTLVYSRETMHWQMDHANPNNDIKEWIDEQAGSVMKWPVPILSSTRIEWLPEVKSDLFILQTPVHLDAKSDRVITDMIQRGQPIAIFGTPVGGIPTRWQQLGLIGIKNVDRLEKIHHGAIAEAGQSLALNLPATFTTLHRLSRNRCGIEARVLYSVDDSPVLALNTSDGKRILTWDPPVFFSIGKWGKTKAVPGFRHPVCCEPLVNVWGGSAAPYALTAGALNYLLSTPGHLRAKFIDMDQTMNICAWHTTDGICILAANLEEGIRDSKDQSCQAIMILPESWRIGNLTDSWSTENIPVQKGEIFIQLAYTQSRLLTATL